MSSTTNILILLLALPLVSFSQKKKDVDTVKVERSYRPTQLRFGTDVFALVRTVTQEGYRGWELNADADIYRYFLALDFGSSAMDKKSETDHYENSGTYFRIGGDFNFLKKDVDKNALFLGLRYARSKFSEDMTIVGTDPVWGAYQDVYTNKNATASWIEATGGLKVRIWKMLWLGYTARFKFGVKASENPDMVSHDIPGFGSFEEKTTWGFNYQMFFTIPLKKKE